jgi:hypothetical protein
VWLNCYCLCCYHQLSALCNLPIFDLVEAVGIEPTSRDSDLKVPTCLFRILYSPAKTPPNRILIWHTPKKSRSPHRGRSGKPVCYPVILSRLNRHSPEGCLPLYAAKATWLAPISFLPLFTRLWHLGMQLTGRVSLSRPFAPIFFSSHYRLFLIYTE